MVALPDLARAHTIVGTAGARAERRLRFRVEMVVAADETVRELACVVSAWARAELGAVLRECADKRDPQTLLYAIDSYQRMCAVRAKTWRRLAAAFPELAGALEGKAALGRWWGVDVLRFRVRGTGRKQKDEGPELVVRWGIRIDWVGEAESEVEAAARVPGACRLSTPRDWEAC